MIKRIISITLIVILLISSPISVLACDEEQSDVYVSKILFGEYTLDSKEQKNAEILLSGLYLCSEQSDNNGKEKFSVLKNAKVKRIPSLEQININSNMLYDCSHNSWNYEVKKIEEQQEARKSVLRKTVIKVLDFGWFNEIFMSSDSQIDSFAAFLYYLHILADYLANNPEETELSAKGYDIPAFSGCSYMELNGNIPSFSMKDKKSTKAYTQFSSLDAYGRTGVAMANIGPELLAPAGSRQSIGNIKPAGWKQEKYEGLVSSQPPYVYNRCHLIAHQLVNYDAATNLITGTRYLNEAMIPFEDMVATYVQETENHVLYRATPVYESDNLVASGVQLEAYSVEDEGKGICFNVYLYNVQPGVNIDYANGSTERADNIYGSDHVIPFATISPTDQNPDLMYEIEKQLEILFENQKDSTEYKNMMNELNLIADEARSVSGDTEYKMYAALKQCQYDYVEKLIEYVPELLKNEDFFNSVFN